MRFETAIGGDSVDFEVFLLLKNFRLEYDVSCSGVEDLRKSMRQDFRLVLGRISNLDDEPASFEAKCLKNLGRTGRQPTMMPIAISAKLGRCQYDENIYGRVFCVRPEPNPVNV